MKSINQNMENIYFFRFFYGILLSIVRRLIKKRHTTCDMTLLLLI